MTAPRRLLAAAVLAMLAAAPACGRLPRIVVLSDPLTPAEHVALGVSYERAGELDRAAAEYGRALRRDPAFFQARVNLGNVRAAQKRYGEARGEYLEALAIRANDPEATNNLAWTAVLSGEGIDDALERMEEVVKGSGGRTPPLLDTLGVLRGRAGRREEAAAALAEAERLCLADPAACPEGLLDEIRGHAREVAGPGAPGDGAAGAGNLVR